MNHKGINNRTGDGLKEPMYEKKRNSNQEDRLDKSKTPFIKDVQ